MVSDGGIQIPIQVIDLASPEVNQIIASLNTLGEEGKTAFAELDAAGQKTATQLSSLNARVAVASSEFKKLAADVNVTAEAEEVAAAKLLGLIGEYNKLVTSLQVASAETGVFTGFLSDADQGILGFTGLVDGATGALADFTGANAYSATVIAEQNGVMEQSVAVYRAHIAELTKIADAESAASVEAIAFGESQRALITSLIEEDAALGGNVAALGEYIAELNAAQIAADRLAAAQARMAMTQTPEALGFASVAANGGNYPVPVGSGARGPLSDINAMQQQQWMAAQQNLEQSVAPATNAISNMGAALRGAGGDMMTFGTRARQTGMNISMGLTLPILAVGGIAVASASNFQEAMNLLYTSAGAPIEEVKKMTAAVLDMAQNAPQGPNALATALYHLESVGLRGSLALDALKASSMGAAIGNADLESVTNALAGALVSGIRGTEDSKQAMASLVAIAGVGNMRFQELADSLGTFVLPAGRALGISLTDVGGALTVMTDAGKSADAAGTALRYMFGQLGGPTNQATKYFEALGLSQLDVARQIREGGLLSGLQLLKTHLDSYSTDPTVQTGILDRMFGQRSGSAIVALLQNLDRFNQKVDQINQSSSISEFDKKYAVAMQNFNNQWGEFVSRLEVDAIKIGNAIMPAALALMDTLEPAITSITDAFVDLDPKLQEVILGFAVMVAILGPALILIGAMSSGVGVLVSGLGMLASTLGAAAGAFGIFGAAEGGAAVGEAGVAAGAGGGIAAGVAGLAEAAAPVLAVVAALAVLAGAIYIVATDFKGLRDDVIAFAAAAGATLLGGGIIPALLLMKYEGVSVQEAFERMGQGIAAVFYALPVPMQEAIAGIVNPVIDGINTIIGVINTLIDAWNKVAGYIILAGAPLALVFAPFIIAIEGAIAAFNLLHDHWSQIVAGIANAAAAAWSFIVGITMGAVGAVSGLFDIIGNVWSSVMDALPSPVQGALDTIKNLFEEAIGWIVEKLNDLLGKIGEVVGWLNKLPGVSLGQVPTIDSSITPDQSGGMLGPYQSDIDKYNAALVEIDKRRQDMAAWQAAYGGGGGDYTGATELPNVSGGGGASSDMTKTEFGLISLAEAFKIFNAQTGSSSIPAFKAWLEMESKLSDATEKHTAEIEAQQNPMLSMIMALGAIRTHILEANETIEQFLRNEVFMPALEGFKSALDALFSHPTREVLTLQLQKDQLELQKIQRQKMGATDEELKGIDNQIQAVDREIQMRDKLHDILKIQAELNDKTLPTEQDLFDQSRLLGIAIGQTSNEVWALNSAVLYQTLAAINAGNAFNYVADTFRGAGGGAGNAVGGPAGGRWSVMNEGSSGSNELVRLPSGSWVVSARQASAMMSGGGGSYDNHFHLSIMRDANLRQQVMQWINEALTSSQYGNASINSSTYAPE